MGSIHAAAKLKNKKIKILDTDALIFRKQHAIRRNLQINLIQFILTSVNMVK